MGRKANVRLGNQRSTGEADKKPRVPLKDSAVREQGQVLETACKWSWAVMAQGSALGASSQPSLREGNAGYGTLCFA